MKFNEAFEKILVLEGKPSNNPKDPGGNTKWGISQRAFPKLDIMSLTKNEARNIYFIYYWELINTDKLPDNIRFAVFDCAVNQGARVAAKLLQTIIGAKSDGFIGKKTLEAISLYKKNLKSVYLLKRAYRYSQTNNYDQFGKGWINRLCEVA